jgi:multimeric flavodoxin WrbA
MKVTGIVGSPRKNGNTGPLTRHRLEAISEDGLETELIRLAGLEIEAFWLFESQITGIIP